MVYMCTRRAWRSAICINVLQLFWPSRYCRLSNLRVWGSAPSLLRAMTLAAVVKVFTLISTNFQVCTLCTLSCTLAEFSNSGFGSQQTAGIGLFCICGDAVCFLIWGEIMKCLWPCHRSVGLSVKELGRQSDTRWACCYTNIVLIRDRYDVIVDLPCSG
jgi:hypothetical protein